MPTYKSAVSTHSSKLFVCHYLQDRNRNVLMKNLTHDNLFCTLPTFLLYIQTQWDTTKTYASMSVKHESLQPPLQDHTSPSYRTIHMRMQVQLAFYYVFFSVHLRCTNFSDPLQNAESLGECLERNAEGMLKNMAIHELALLASFYDVTVENIESVSVDKEFSSLQTLKGPR